MSITSVSYFQNASPDPSKNSENAPTSISHQRTRSAFLRSRDLSPPSTSPRTLGNLPIQPSRIISPPQTPSESFRIPMNPDPNVRANSYLKRAQEFLEKNVTGNALELINAGLSIPEITDNNLRARLYAIQAQAYLRSAEYQNALNAANSGLAIQGTDQHVRTDLFWKKQAAESGQNKQESAAKILLKFR